MDGGQRCEGEVGEGVGGASAGAFHGGCGANEMTRQRLSDTKRHKALTSEPVGRARHASNVGASASQKQRYLCRTRQAEVMHTPFA
eukprot:5822088-Pleurochrysis_carterae.AAC.1